jgi:quercetin dioxygenase-like cupin family protein
MENNKESKDRKLPASQVAKTAALVEYQSGSIVSREILKTTTGRVTVFAFDEAEGLSEHISPFDALVQVLEGEVEITISGKPYRLTQGELILMPANHPHALKAVKRFKMLLTMLRS